MTASPQLTLDKQHLFLLDHPFHWSAASSGEPLSVFSRPWVSENTQSDTSSLCFNNSAGVETFCSRGFLPELLPVLQVRLHVQLDAEQLFGQRGSQVRLLTYFLKEQENKLQGLHYREWDLEWLNGAIHPGSLVSEKPQILLYFAALVLDNPMQHACWPGWASTSSR